MKYVYLLRTAGNHYKVGVATSVEKRVNNIQTSNPNPIEVVSTVIVDDAYALEGELHKKLQSLRSKGGTEWFGLTPEEAIEIAILMHQAPEVDVSTRVSLNNQLVEQRLRHKSLEKKLDTLIGMSKRPRYAVKNEATDVKEDLENRKSKKKSVNDDETMLLALDIFREKGKASTSLLQRSLSVGYGRAARIMDKLEKAGYISELDGARPRSLLGKAIDDTDEDVID